MDPPTILITDHTTQTPLTTHYISPTLTLSLLPIYTALKRLPHHPGHGFISTNPPHPIHPCSASFLQTYWSLAACLLDYFTTFYALDTPLNQSLWFALLDLWQETAADLPHTWDAGYYSIACPHAQEFEGWVHETLDLLRGTIMAARGERMIAGGAGAGVVWDPSGKREEMDGGNSGPWVSGLKGWQQFLCESAPGAAMRGPGVSEAADEEEAGAGVSRCVPMPGIAIVHKHTSRAQQAADDLAALGEPEFLASFEEHALVFPAEGVPQNYTAVDGRTVKYALGNGMPPVSRYAGLVDEEMEEKEPMFTMVDDFVGVCKGVEIFQGMVGQDENDDEEGVGDEDVPFDVWTVWVGGERGKGKNVLGEGWEEMFETWEDDNS